MHISGRLLAPKVNANIQYTPVTANAGIPEDTAASCSGVAAVLFLHTASYPTR